MSWFSRAWAWLTARDAAADLIGGWQFRDTRNGGATRVTDETALRHSAVWACLRLRADLVSMMPVDVYRRVGGYQVEVSTPQWLVEPYPGWTVGQWLWGSQFDLDRYGNTFGLITKKTPLGKIAELEPVAASDVQVLTKGRRVTNYRISGELVPPEWVWHETQYRPAGSPLGLSPIAAAAMSISGYLSAQQFAMDWYNAGASPAGVLRNTNLAEIPQQLGSTAKAKFKEAVKDRDIFVAGKNWEWTPAAGDANSAAFLDEMRYGIADVCRFLSVPGDMIDAPADGTSITYANVTQRNVQLLVVNLSSPVKRREDAFTAALPRPQYSKLNSDAVLRMDPKTRAEVLEIGVKNRWILPSEVRLLMDMPAMDEAGYQEFDRLFGAPRQQAPVDTARMLERPDYEPPVSIGWHLPRELETGRG